MIDLGRLQFATAPATGAVWMCRAFTLVGLGDFSYSRHLAYQPFPKDERGISHPFRVSMVRHPYSWLYGVFCASEYHEVLQKFLSFCKTDWDVFLNQYLNSHVSVEDVMVDQYKADTFLRAEDLPGAFIELAKSLEIWKPEFEYLDHFRKKPRVDNVPEVVIDRMGWTGRVEVAETEWHFNELFDYFQ